MKSPFVNWEEIQRIIDNRGAYKSILCKDLAKGDIFVSYTGNNAYGVYCVDYISGTGVFCTLYNPQTQTIELTHHTAGSFRLYKSEDTNNIHPVALDNAIANAEYIEKDFDWSVKKLDNNWWSVTIYKPTLIGSKTFNRPTFEEAMQLAAKWIKEQK